MKELQIIGNNLTLILCNNINAIKLTNISIVYAKTKYIDVKYHYVKNKVQVRSINISNFLTTIQYIKILTKLLFKFCFTYNREKI